MPATHGPRPYGDILRLSREGPAPLAEPVPGMADRPLHIATIIPPFARGSGGHGTIFTLLSRLERDGPHLLGLDVRPARPRRPRRAAVLRRRMVEEFTPVRAPMYKGFDDWNGADVALATGWDTAYATMLLPGCRARAYLVQDHEPEFYATSAESIWAAQTYELGLYGIAASRWLRDLLARRYGQRGTWFRLGVDHGVYRQRPVERRRDTVIALRARVHAAPGRAAREAGARGAAPAPARHALRRSSARPRTSSCPFEYELLGITTPEVLAWRYSAGDRRPLPVAHQLLADPAGDDGLRPALRGPRGRQHRVRDRRDGRDHHGAGRPGRAGGRARGAAHGRGALGERSRAGLAFVETASWDVAAKQVEAGLRNALREREPALELADRLDPGERARRTGCASAPGASSVTAVGARTGRSASGPSDAAPVAVAGREVAAAAHERGAVAAGVEPHATELDPVVGLRELVPHRSELAAVDARVDRAAERARQPHLVLARRAARAAARRPRPVRPSARAPDAVGQAAQPNGSGASAGTKRGCVGRGRRRQLASPSRACAREPPQVEHSRFAAGAMCGEDLGLLLAAPELVELARPDAPPARRAGAGRRGRDAGPRARSG